MLPLIRHLNIIYEPVTQQQNNYDCGPLSIASAVALSFSISPCQLKFDLHQLRPHLLHIFNTRQIMMFPTQNHSILINDIHNTLNCRIHPAQTYCLNHDEIAIMETQYTQHMFNAQENILNYYNIINKNLNINQTANDLTDVYNIKAPGLPKKKMMMKTRQ